MEIERTAAIQMFVELGYYGAPQWSLERLQAKIDDPRELVRFLHDESPPQLLFLAATQEREAIVVVEDLTPIAEQPKKAHKVKQPRRRPVGTYAEQIQSWQESPIDTPQEGIAAAVIEVLRAAGRTKRPVTRREIHESLTEQFPERDERGMETNVKNLVPTRLKRHYNIQVQRVRLPNTHGQMGYWIEPDPT